MERKKIEILSGSINYLESGIGQSIIFIHGGFGNAPDLMEWAKNVFPNFKLIVPFLPGHGSHDLKNDNYREILNSFSQFGQKFDLKNCVLWGHSFGGRIVFDLLTQNLFDAQKAVLISPLLTPINKNIAKVSFGIIKDYVRDLKGSRLSSRKEVPIQTYFKNSKKIWSILRNLDSVNSPINTPLLLIWGENDNVVPLHENRNSVEKLKPDFYRQFKGGHFNFFNNSEISKLMRDFINF